MLLPHEQVGWPRQRPPITINIDTSPPKHNRQDGSHPQARDITEETNPLTPTLSVEDVSDDRPNSCDDSQVGLEKNSLTHQASYCPEIVLRKARK